MEIGAGVRDDAIALYDSIYHIYGTLPRILLTSGVNSNRLSIINLTLHYPAPLEVHLRTCLEVHLRTCSDAVKSIRRTG